MASKQALIQEIDMLPPDSIDKVFQFVLLVKHENGTSGDAKARLKEFDALMELILAGEDEPMPPIEPIGSRPPFEYGSMSGTIRMAEDFCAPLDDFAGYM